MNKFVRILKMTQCYSKLFKTFRETLQDLRFILHILFQIFTKMTAEFELNLIFIKSTF